MKKNTPGQTPTGMRKKTAEEITAENRARDRAAAQQRKAAKPQFKWGDLDAFHKECQQLFSVVVPVVEAIRSEDTRTKLTAKGLIDTFTGMARAFSNDIQSFTARLEDVRNMYVGRVVTEDNMQDELMHGVAVSEEYRQWMDSFNTVIVHGTAADISGLLLDLE